MLATLRRPLTQPNGEALSAESLKEADLIAIPGLAVSTDGICSGRGEDWHDRTPTHRSPGIPAVMVILDDEALEVEIIPAEPRDVPVDGIATPIRTIAVNLR